MIDSGTEVFESHRRFLRGLAYRMLGSVAEAEDLVQDCWIRWRDIPHESILDSRAFLAQTMTRLCLDRLKSAQHQRESYFGVWLPEPWVDDWSAPAPAADEALSLAQDLEVAFLLVLERLTPAERAVFLLNEVFEWDFDAIGQMLDRSAVACRQLAKRARQQFSGEPEGQPRPPRRQPGGRQRDTQKEMLVAAAFAHALQQGDVEQLAKTLAQDVVFLSDGGGKAHAVPRPLDGASKVAQVLVGFAELWARHPGTVTPAIINGLPGAIFIAPEGHVVQTMAIDIGADGLVAGLYVVRNPDKLKHVPLP